MNAELERSAPLGIIHQCVNHTDLPPREQLGQTPEIVGEGFEFSLCHRFSKFLRGFRISRRLTLGHGLQ